VRRATGPVKLGYLVSQYPAVNHTFILREVIALRREGLDPCTVSIRRSDRRVEMLSTDEADEHRRTFCVLGAGLTYVMLANLRTMLFRPISYARALIYAWKLTRGTPKLLFTYSAYFIEAVIAGDYFERQGVTFVHTHFSSTVLLILARIFPVRYSLTIHGPAEFADVVGFHMADKVAAATFVATISRYGSSQVMAACDPSHWHKIRTLRLGVDPQGFPPREVPSKRDGDALRLVFVGRLAPVKAQHILVETVALLSARGRKVLLDIVGEGPNRPVLEKLIEERGMAAQVQLCGACNHDKVSDFYRNSDVFVLASFAEGIPVVLMEAMAMQLPCVATRITGIPELIDDGMDGLLVPPADPAALADAVERLMDDPALAARIGVAARNKILSTYNLERNTELLGKTFREFLSVDSTDSILRASDSTRLYR
jgi:colanic acid/amylovoran biosynthesis glycosyltransferase